MFSNIWAALLKKSPKLADPTTVVEFTSKNLKSLLEQVYDKGVASVEKAETASYDYMSMFESIMKKKK
jgi:hypothetical protein